MRTLSRAAALLTFIAHQNLVFQVLPYLFVDLGETRLETDFGDVAWPGEVDLVGALDRAGSGGDDEDPVAERNRLFQGMGHEHDRCRARGPQGKRLVFHP